MGDGIQRKFAIILNGDIEPRHLENVDRAAAALKAEGVEHIAVASTQAPKEKVSTYTEASTKGLAQIAAGIAADDDDMLTVYVTGHGKEEAGQETCIDLGKSCLPFSQFKEQLDKITYGRRAIIMDNCFSGGTLDLFANAKTSVVTQGSEGETVSCQEFSPHFWSPKATDFDGNGVVTLQERYRYALETGKTTAHSQFYEPQIGLSLSGKAPAKGNFPTEVPQVHNGRALAQHLGKLKPGELALVTFSADWCGPCQKYQPVFEGLAKQYQGRFMMIRAEGKNGSETDWSAYGVKSFPTVAFIDFRGNVIPVKDRDDPLASLKQAALVGQEERLNKALEALLSKDPSTLLKDIHAIGSLGNAAKAAIPTLLDYLKHPDGSVQRAAANALLRMESELPKYCSQIWELSASAQRGERIGASLVLGALAKKDPEMVKEALIPALHSADPNQRSGAIMALAEGQYGAREMFALLRRETNPEVREDAIFAIGKNPDAKIYLSNLVRNSDGKTNEELLALTSALWACKDPSPEFRTFLLRQLRSSDPKLAGMAAVTLVDSGRAQRQDLDILLQLLHQENAERLDIKVTESPLVEALVSALTPENTPRFSDFQYAIMDFGRKHPRLFPKILQALSSPEDPPKLREENEKVLRQSANDSLKTAATLIRLAVQPGGDSVMKMQALALVKQLDRETLRMVFEVEEKNFKNFFRLYEAMPRGSSEWKNLLQAIETMTPEKKKQFREEDLKQPDPIQIHTRPPASIQ